MEPVAGRYGLVALLGAGASGEAWRATDLTTQQSVVVKLLHKQFASSSRHGERFRREIKALQELRHPHVVVLLDWGRCEVRGQPFYTMAYAPGVPLSKVVRGEKVLETRRALRLIDQLLQALELAHGRKILHRDLKPDNLLIQDPGSPVEHLRVLDFGLAKHLDGGKRTKEQLTGGVIGTPLYLAPEQCTSKAELATDVYAVGCILMKLLSGEPPFHDDDLNALLRKHVKDAPPRLASRVPGCPPALDEAVAACLAKVPAARPTAGALRRTLLQVALGLPRPAVAGTVELPVGRTVELGPDSVLTLCDLPGPVDEPLPDSGPALRLRLQVGAGRITVFAGTRLRFGRNRGNDLTLRAVPRPGERAEDTSARTLRVSGDHGVLLLTRRGAAVVDLGSKLGTLVDGEPLEALVPRAVSGAFRLRVAGWCELEGSVLAGPRRCVRLRDGEAPGLLYVVLDGPVTIGASDPIRLVLPGVVPGHAVLDVVGRTFAIGPARPDAAVTVGGRRLAPGERAPLPPGVHVVLGATALRVLPEDEP